MTGRSTVYHVAPVSGEEYGWEIRTEGAARAQTQFQSKCEAMAAAMRLARSELGSRVCIHHLDGTVESCAWPEQK